jgi:hypothetical protein
MTSRLPHLLCLAVAASSQAALAQSTPTATAPAPVAHVYVQTPRGVNLYNTSPTGQLTLVAGSPFNTIGLMVGTNGKYFLSNGTNYVHVYAMSSSGAIGKEVSNINTAHYSGSECGTTGPSVLDHTGQSLYVQLTASQLSGRPFCSAFQSYKIGNTGQLTFVGSTEQSVPLHAGAPTPLTISGQDIYAYNINTGSIGYEGAFVEGFKRTASTGSLDQWNVAVSNPQTYDSSWMWMQFGVTSDPTNHLAVFDMQEQGLPYGPLAFPQLASYTMDSSGNLTTTNTYRNMPAPSVFPGVMNMSPSGRLLAIGSPVDYSACSCGTAKWGTAGLQVFHFNGANPITRYSATLTKTPIDNIHWDKANHLYALSHSTGKLYVYTVTPTSITAVSGSPYVISSPTALIVR